MPIPTVTQRILKQTYFSFGNNNTFLSRRFHCCTQRG